ncbi:MAG TPA: hypothetical protein PK001_04990 [Dokdonella sp.]|uniref:hypothetical protein n=1 Tax=Dokdonella sp. TaxID=2291710 RepID=UPI002CB8ADFA|nr:hypothetical protein [Dokdonella sp.]HOX71078.1 hypothetical protein [Dokdonella sp.]
MWENFGSMPKLLKFLTAHAACCFLFFAISVINIDAYAIQGRHVTYAEWWSSGAGVFASLTGLVGLIVAWALASKRPYARPAYLGFLTLALVAPCAFFGQLPYALPGLLAVGAGALYMYRRQSVQVYFALNRRVRDFPSTPSA